MRRRERSQCAHKSALFSGPQRKVEKRCSSSSSSSSSVSLFRDCHLLVVSPKLPMEFCAIFTLRWALRSAFQFLPAFVSCGLVAGRWQGTVGRRRRKLSRYLDYSARTSSAHRTYVAFCFPAEGPLASICLHLHL